LLIRDRPFSVVIRKSRERDALVADGAEYEADLEGFIFSRADSFQRPVFVFDEPVLFELYGRDSAVFTDDLNR
jgi:hypothetical protein